jgi:hypothetical protein
VTRRRAGATCDFSGKRRYRDKTEATNAVRHFQRHSERDVVPVRVYPCHMCKGYHLTSQAYKENP